MSWQTMVILGLAVGTAACSRDGNEEAPGRSKSATEAEHDERVAFAANDDVAFIDAVIPHHRMAVDMADHQLAHGARTGVKKLAADIKEKQTSEIGELEAQRQELASSKNVPPMDDPAGKRQMATLAAARGEELDRMFLEAMRAHHGGALDMAHRSLPNLKDPEIAAFARRMLQDQSKEIAEINALLGEEKPVR